MSASGIRNTKFLAPPLDWTRLPCFVPVSKMYFAIGVEPTKEMALTFGWVNNALTHSRPPWTRFRTPLGKPACSSNLAIWMAVNGTFSLGLRTKVLPQTSATGYIQRGTIAGKLKGEMPTQTHSDSGTVAQSMARALS